MPATSVVTPLTAPSVVTSKAELSTEKVPAPEKAMVPVEARPVAPEMAPVLDISMLVV